MLDSVSILCLSRKYKFSSYFCHFEWGIKNETRERSYCPGLTALFNLPTGESKFYL